MKQIYGSTRYSRRLMRESLSCSFLVVTSETAEFFRLRHVHPLNGLKTSFDVLLWRSVSFTFLRICELFLTISSTNVLKPWGLFMCTMREPKNLLWVQDRETRILVLVDDQYHRTNNICGMTSMVLRVDFSSIVSAANTTEVAVQKSF